MIIIAQLFFMFSRTVAALCVVTVKDVFFSFTLLLFIPLLYECAETSGLSLLKHPRNLLLFFFASACTIVIRNNGIFVMVGTAIIIMLSCRKYWKQIVLICSIAVLLPYGTDHILMKALVKQDKIMVESLAIPLQQMAAVVARGGKMDEQETAVMNTIMPYDKMMELYTPTSSDSLKWGTGKEYLNKTWIADNMDVFLSTWASMLRKNLDIYIEAYLLETLSYWSIGEPSIAQGIYYSYPHNDSIDICVDQIRVFPEALQTGLEQYYKLDVNKDSPSGGTLIWLLLLAILYAVCHNQKQLILSLFPFVMVWVTIMVSAPIAYGLRYIYALYIVSPFLIPMLTLPLRKDA